MLSCSRHHPINAAARGRGQQFADTIMSRLARSLARAHLFVRTRLETKFDAGQCVQQIRGRSEHCPNDKATPHRRSELSAKQLEEASANNTLSFKMEEACIPKPFSQCCMKNTQMSAEQQRSPHESNSHRRGGTRLLVQQS